MTEDFLQFIWKSRLFKDENIFSTQGDVIEILEVGRQNFDAGPDFFDARIKINDILWAGNVEIHIKSSYWYAHKHHNDEAYDNVILHVIYEDNGDVILNNARVLPSLKLDFDYALLATYNSLMNSQKWIPCFDDINSVDRFFVRNWLQRMMIERLERKSKEIKEILKQNSFSWEETFYQLLARYFGMKVNSDPFQQLAQSIPINILSRQKNSLLQIEALLFGQAGMLNLNCEDSYFKNLCREYKFLAVKYNLSPIPESRWKWLRLRPANFPTIRIAQLASLMFKTNSLCAKIIKAADYPKIKEIFNVETSAYWHNHYQFGKESIFRHKKLGSSAVDGIIINSVVPLMFVYGEINGGSEVKDKALDLLDQMPAENNSVVNKWKDCGVEIKSAFDSQSLLQLKSNYCDKFKCLQCEFGNRIIRAGLTGTNIT
ncbi:DUF2851 family protein [Marinifilum sp. RC60d5]|uniref:DUF2851 family protein n=1 Tax=Marinifilum sp. RC60d5 TaxID=3458414 RepID=UPI00403662C6